MNPAAIPPQKKTSFSKQLIRQNSLDVKGFDRWLFAPGMLFRSREKWWGDPGMRPKPHEGIDICFYADKSKKVFRLDETARIPVMYGGEIVKMEKDFLGISVYVSHEIFDTHNRQLHTAYGHTQPFSDMGPGTGLKEGQAFAGISPITGKKNNMIPHLHLSMLWVEGTLSYGALNWEAMHRDPPIKLINPLNAMECQYAVLSEEHLFYAPT